MKCPATCKCCTALPALPLSQRGGLYEVDISIAGGVSVSTMKQKPVWEKENPKKKSTPLTSSQKASAKARAAKAGRPYPNLIDNMAASRAKKKK